MLNIGGLLCNYSPMYALILSLFENTFAHDDLVRHLVYVRNSRTLRYRAAWLLHIVVILFSFGMLLVKLSGI